MALIKCPACGKDVSDKAPSCPSCGHPIAPTTIELTSKKWKVIKLLGWVAFIIGALLFFGGVDNGGFHNTQAGMGFTLAFLGFIVLVVGKFGAWWTNK